MYWHPDAVSVIHFFISHAVKTNLINTKLGDFVELGVHFMTM